MVVQISKKRKLVTDGIFKAQLNEVSHVESWLKIGCSGVEAEVTSTRTEMISWPPGYRMFLVVQIWLRAV